MRRAHLIANQFALSASYGREGEGGENTGNLVSRRLRACMWWYIYVHGGQKRCTEGETDSCKSYPPHPHPDI